MTDAVIPYIGDGTDYHTGIPPRDLSGAEFAALDADQQAVVRASRVYDYASFEAAAAEVASEPEPTPEATPEAPAAETPAPEAQADAAPEADAAAPEAEFAVPSPEPSPEPEAPPPAVGEAGA